MVMVLNRMPIPVIRQDVVNTSISMRISMRSSAILSQILRKPPPFFTEKAWLHHQFTTKDPDGTERWRLVLTISRFLQNAGTSLSATLHPQAQQVDLQYFFFSCA